MNDDRLLSVIASLPKAESDAARTARLRAKCSAILNAGRQAREQPRQPSPLWPLMAGLGGLYAAEVIYQTLRYYRLV